MYLLIVDRQSNSDWGTRPFTRSRGAPAQPEILDSGRQLELDFRAPVLQLVLPDQKTQEFWRATADDQTGIRASNRKIFRRMQQCAIVKPDEARSQKRAAKWPK